MERFTLFGQVNDWRQPSLSVTESLDRVNQNSVDTISSNRALVEDDEISSN
ncbi:MAG TPA: hypothetical protein ACHBX0_07790 [Arsenophonus sp.]